MMKYAIVYSSRTGNTKLLAETLHAVLDPKECIYFGAPGAAALQADRIYAGFWTDQGSCDADTAAFLDTVTDQQVFLFGTAGFGGSSDYFDHILENVQRHLSSEAAVVGRFMCQGKMPLSVRARYEKMQLSPAPNPRLQALIENFDQALSHPDAADLEALRGAVRSIT